MSKIKIPNWIIAILDGIVVFAGVILGIVDPSIITNHIEAFLATVLPVLGLNVYPCFNNAKKTPEDAKIKAELKAKRQATKQAKLQLKEKQKKELEALTNQKLAEAQLNNNQNV